MKKPKKPKQRSGYETVYKIRDILKTRYGFPEEQIYIVYRVPYHKVDIWSADLIATCAEYMLWIQSTVNQFYTRKVKSMHVPMPSTTRKEAWIWKDKKNLFYIYDIFGKKLREEV